MPSFQPDSYANVINPIGGGIFRVGFYETEDSFEDVLAEGYFARARDSGIRAGDAIEVLIDGSHYSLEVISINAVGTATVRVAPEDARFVKGLVDRRNADGMAEHNAAILSALPSGSWKLPAGIEFDCGHVAPDLTDPNTVWELIGEGSQTIYGPASIFTNIGTSDGAGTEYGSHAVMFSFEGEVIDLGLSTASVNYGGRAVLRGIKIVGPVGTGDVSTAYPGLWSNVVCARFMDCVEIVECEITGWSKGAGIALTGVQRGRIERNHIHDNVGDSGRDEFGSGGPEIWGIIIDDNKPYNDVPDAGGFNRISYSKNLFIHDNHIHDINDINVFHQCDGINIQTMASDISLKGNHIHDTGECFDVFGTNLNISGNILHDSWIGVKIVHGASYINTSGNIIHDMRQFGVLYGASGIDGHETEHHTCVGNSISRINMDDENLSAACINVTFNAASALGVVQYITVMDNHLNPLGAAFTILAAGEGNNQYFINNHEIVRGSAATAGIIPGFIPGFHDTGLAELVHRGIHDAYTTYVSARLTADKTNIIGGGAPVTLAGWTVLSDRRDNFDATTGIATLTEAGQYELSFLVTFGQYTAGHTAFYVIVRTKNEAGVTLKDWTFYGGDMEPANELVSISATVGDIFVEASLPVTVEVLAEAIGGATTVDVLSNSSSFHYSNLTIKRV